MIIRSVICLQLFLWASPALAESYAFLVGVRDYSLHNELAALKYSENDVHQLASTLFRSGVPEANITLMTQKMSVVKARYSPISHQIRKELSLLLSQLKAGDTIIVGFSGHGLQFKSDPVNYFCPSDARLDDKTTLISLTQVYEDLESSAATSKVLLVDACRNDPISENRKSVKVVQLEPVSDRKPPILEGGTVAIFSCSATQFSFEHKDLENGLFFHFVNRALSGEADMDKDGTVDLFELEAFAMKNVQQWARVNIGEMQTPERRGSVRGGITLINLGKNSRPNVMPKPATPFKNTIPKSITTSIGISLNLIPAGMFMMGSPESEMDRDEDERHHRVTLSKPFYMGTTEVTQRQWESEKGTRPWENQKNTRDGDYYPVSYVSWEDAVEYCKKLSAIEGKEFRLPTEAEWEFACRGGTTSAYSFGDERKSMKDYAWYDENALNVREAYAHVVGSKRPNAYGLYDMHGNVSEWCADWHKSYTTGSLTDPTGPDRGLYRVFRGGSYRSLAWLCRSAYRSNDTSSYRNSYLGFRVALSP